MGRGFDVAQEQLGNISVGRGGEGVCIQRDIQRITLKTVCVCVCVAPVT